MFDRILFLKKMNSVNDEDPHLLLGDNNLRHSVHFANRYFSGIIQKQNLKQGAGKLVNANQEIIIKAQGDASSVEEIKNIIVKIFLYLS